jgi:hypothetical protein
MRRAAWSFILFIAICLNAHALADEPEGTNSPTELEREALELFERTVRPTLIRHCYDCHSADADQLEAGLRVDHAAGLLTGGDSGAAVVPGDPDESLLIAAIEYDGYQMPPDQKLPAETIAGFRRWIQLGATDPRVETSPPATASTKSIDWTAAQSFWAFQPPALSSLPRVSSTEWPRRRHDTLVLARLEAAGLSPSPQADPSTLRRRLWFDLLGLPPSEEELAATAPPTSEESYAELVDQLLQRAEFGERWARLWLRLARYAEDQAHIVGDDKSLFYPNAYRYRDWVIGAFNSDMPFDQFVRRQLAADLMGDEDHQVALGFLGLGPKYYDRGRLEVQAEEWEDRVDTVSRTLLGLTVACARCHDHKYDPIPTSDYYAMASVFASTEMFNCPLPVDHTESASEEPEQTEKTAADIAVEKKRRKPNPEEAIHIVREGKPTDLKVFVRGNVESPGEQVQRGFLSVLGGGSRPQFHEGSGRRELADAIVHPDNPLTARVFVNRVWSELMGHRLVGTPSNFGTLGQTPTHPELLNDLAVRFVQNHWSVKWLVREIVTSSTYRQTSEADPALVTRDPSNVLLGRIQRKRLEVEAWRDSLLVASGRLERTLGGPSIRPDDPASTRRTVYSEVSRFQLNPMLAVFDFPDANVHASMRSETTTPLQKLFVMNHPFVLQQAQALGDLWATRYPDASEVAVDRMYQRVFAREASPAERDLGLQFVRDAKDISSGWQLLAHALLASNEMLFVD